MGTRFLLAQESPVPLATKQRYLKCHSPNDIAVSKVVDGMPQRMIENELLQQLEKAGTLTSLILALVNGFKYKKFSQGGYATMLKAAWKMSRQGGLTFTQAVMAANAPMLIQKAMVSGEPSQGILPSGQVAADISSILSCEDIINGIIKESLEQLQAMAKPFETAVQRPTGRNDDDKPSYTITH